MVDGCIHVPIFLAAEKLPQAKVASSERSSGKYRLNQRMVLSSICQGATAANNASCAVLFAGSSSWLVSDTIHRLLGVIGAPCQLLMKSVMCLRTWRGMDCSAASSMAAEKRAKAWAIVGFGFAHCRSAGSSASGRRFNDSPAVLGWRTARANMVPAILLRGLFSQFAFDGKGVSLSSTFAIRFM